MKYEEGKKKLVWFSKDQLSVLDDIQAITGESNSQAIRSALDAYKEALKYPKRYAHIEYLECPGEPIPPLTMNELGLLMEHDDDYTVNQELLKAQAITIYTKVAK